MRYFIDDLTPGMKIRKKYFLESEDFLAKYGTFKI